MQHKTAVQRCGGNKNCEPKKNYIQAVSGRRHNKYRKLSKGKRTGSQASSLPGISSKISHFSLEKSQRKSTKGNNFISRANGSEGVMGNSRKGHKSATARTNRTKTLKVITMQNGG